MQHRGQDVVGEVSAAPMRAAPYAQCLMRCVLCYVLHTLHVQQAPYTMPVAISTAWSSPSACLLLLHMA